MHGQAAATTTLRPGEPGTFVLLYSSDGAAAPIGRLTVSQGARTVFTSPMTLATSPAGQHYLYDTLTAREAGSYVAHLTLRLGSSVRTRDVRFTIAP